MVIYDVRDVAQLGSAAALGAVGRRFKSCRPDRFETQASVCTRYVPGWLQWGCVHSIIDNGTEEEFLLLQTRRRKTY
jgi:hypothetical protein